ncbi:MAG: ABC transporter ATP-binding protein [Methylotenera sp.]|nr:ABC transporter ATP-binding protein [Oligoflexia bacterium]
MALDPIRELRKKFRSEWLPSWSSSVLNIRRAFGLVWEADSRTTVHLSLITLASGLLPVAQAWVGKLIVDSVVQSMQHKVTFREGVFAALPFLVAEFGLLFFSSAINQFRSFFEEVMDHKLGHSINSRIVKKALDLDLTYFEDADFYDKMQNARRQSEFRAMAIVDRSLLLVQSVVTLISFLILLASFSPWIAFILFFATLPAFIVQGKFSKLNFRLQSWRAPESRMMQYLEQTLTLDSAAKEVKLFGLGKTLQGRNDAIFWKTFREDEALARKRSVASLGWSLLSLLTYYGSYAWIIGITAQGLLTLGSMTLYLNLFRQSQGSIQGLFDHVNKLYENGLFMDNLFSFLALPNQVASPHAGVKVAAGMLEVPSGDFEIEFRNVSYQYASTGVWALKDVNLVIHAREKLALVGENGAGKTTLIKLLTRLYEPTGGAVLLAGRDLREYDLTSLRKATGVIFQDFVKYQLSLEENIGFGSIDELSDHEKIVKAAERGGADDLLPDLKQGWETVLGSWFKGGQELSGGQWQKVALSRAFMRNASILVLDEPTSALDAEKEYEIFHRFRELTEGKIALLVSHRFSTVRMADRIAVLKDGGILELGSHEELVRLGGTYARLFEMQAQGYR